MSALTCSCRTLRATASAPAELIPCKHHEEHARCAYCEDDVSYTVAEYHEREWWHPACWREHRDTRALTDALREEW